ncbi:hypothetical protein [Streptomyces sp. NPDC001502]|uniref:hypothetical protein n=1 Tax=Streptomyces sp. NPDC001502 TaxID=3364578 RepID=UPI003676E8F6
MSPPSTNTPETVVSDPPDLPPPRPGLADDRHRTTAAAERAGRWKADHGRLDGCDSHHDDPHDTPAARPPDRPAEVEAMVRDHVAGHDLVDVLASFTAARDADPTPPPAGRPARRGPPHRRRQAPDPASIELRDFAASPKSPPPQKKPVEPRRPQPATEPKSLTGMPPRLVVTSRRTRVPAFRADQWAAKKAAGQAALAIAEWNYPQPDEHDFLKTVHGLVDTAVAGGGKRVSVHLADQDAKILIMVLSHQTNDQESAGQVPTDVALLRAVDACGTHTDHDGHTWWALLDARPRPKKHLA